MDKVKQHIVKQVRDTHPSRHWQYIIDIAEDETITIIEGYSDLSKGSWVSGEMGTPPEGKIRVAINFTGSPWVSYAHLVEALRDACLDAIDRALEEAEGQGMMEEER